MDYKRLGERIREERLRLHLTQAQLAEDVDISDTYMGAIERGERSLTLDTLVRLVNRLGVTVRLWTTSRWSASSWPSRCYGRSLPTSRKRGHKPLCPRHFPVPQPAHHLHIPEQPLHSQLNQFFYRYRVFRCQGMEFVVEQAVC